MRLSQYIEREQKPRRARKAKKASIATHGSFLPIIALWGAALLGLATFVLPEQMIGRMTALTGGLIDGDGARFVFAGVAALLGGALAFVVGGAWRSQALSQDNGRPITAAVNARRISPITPATDLGSDSLDSPLEGIPFGGAVEDDDVFELTEESADLDLSSKADNMPRKPTLGELAERGYELEEPAVLSKKDRKKAAKKDKGEVAFTHRHFQGALIESCESASCEGATCEASPATDGEAEASTPRALDLEEFGELPNRNGVWVEDQVAAPKKAAEPRPLVPASALEKLRQKPTDELSMVEMVERFAGALHEHQQSERARRPDGGVGRDAALVEALKALTLFTEQGFDAGKPQSNASQLSETERELRNALAKLQTLRGAA